MITTKALNIRIVRKSILVFIFSLLFLTLPGIASAGTGTFRKTGTTGTNGEFDFCVSVRFVATQQQLDKIKEVITHASKMLAEATDGQHRFGNINIVNDSGAAEEAEIWIHEGKGRAITIQPGYGFKKYHINLYYDDNIAAPYGIDQAGLILVHEFGHSAYTLSDEYGTKKDPATGAILGPIVCAPTPTPPRKNDDELTLNYCIMDSIYRGSWPHNRMTFSVREFCVATNHDPDRDTEQSRHHENKSCWETMGGLNATRNGILRTWGLTPPTGLPSTSPAPTAMPTPNYGTSCGPMKAMFLIDRSGSMIFANRLEFARAAAKEFVDAFGEGSLGLASFADIGSVDSTLTSMSTQSARNSLKSAIDSLEPSGETNIGGGLESALSQFIPPASSGCSACEKVIFLLTDGDHNIGTPPEDVISDLQDAGVKVIVVALGTSISREGEARLQELASQTNGEYERVSRTRDYASASNAEQIAVLVRLANESKGNYVVNRDGGFMLSGQTRAFPALIEQSARLATFTVGVAASTDVVQLSLRTPGGAIITQASAAGNPNIKFISTANTRSVEVLGPDAGNWELIVSAESVSTGKVDVLTFAAHDGLQFKAWVADSNVTATDAIEVYAAPTYGGHAVLGASVTGTVARPDGSKMSITLYDDGLLTEHGDQTAGDGVYTSRFRNYNEDGTYIFDLEVQNTNGTTHPGEAIFDESPSNETPVPPFARKTSTTAVVLGTSDLKLGAVTTTAVGGDADIYVEPGESGALSVQLFNNASTAATNITATLTTTTPGVTITTGASSYTDIAPAGNAINLPAFAFDLAADVACGLPVKFFLSVNYNGLLRVYDFTVRTGQPTNEGTVFSYTGSPIPIPDASPAGVNIPFTLSGFADTIWDLNFRIDGSSCTADAGAQTVGIEHSFVSDLVITLTSPQGTTVVLMNRPGGPFVGNNNFCNTILDDEGGGPSIQSIKNTGAPPLIAPHSGVFAPQSPLAAFIGEDPNGTWVMNVSDHQTYDDGNVRAFSLIVNSPNCVVGGPTPTPTPTPTPNVPPTINITSPSNGASFVSGSTVTITANAADSDGTITKVEFFSGTTKLGEDTASPYSFDWANVPVAAHALTARATDSVGATTTSSVVNVVVASGIVSGKVTKQDGGAPIVGATVKVYQGTTLAGSATTNSAGDYTLTGLDTNTYTVEASAQTYITQSQTGVAITNGATTTVNFALESLLPPTLTGFSPAMGPAGTSVTISGTNFNTVPSGNQVKFNTTNATVSSASQTTLVASVPAGATSGKITVTTSVDTAASVNDFYVVPNPYTAADVGYAGRMAVGESKTLTLATANKIGLLLFDGSAGQRVSFKIGGVTINSSSVKIYNPDGTLLASDSVSTSGSFIDTRTLPTSGTYTIFVDPIGTNTGNMIFTLYDVPADALGTIAPGGPSASIATTVPGQNGELSFMGMMGQRVSFKISGVALTGGSGYLDVSLKKPDGTTLASETYIGSSGAFIDTQTLPVTGTYTIFINPHSTNVGSATATLYDVPANATNTITPGGSPLTLTNTVPGQNMQATFAGTSGQRVSLKVSGVTLTGGNGYVDVFLKKPDGTTLASSTYISSSGAFIDAQLLPVTGTYTILVNPLAMNIGSVTLTLYDVPSDTLSTITPGGAPVTVTTTAPGQNARLTFDGAANQRVSLKITGVTITNNNYVSVYVKKPDGTNLASNTVDSSGGYIDTMTLPVAGVYTILVDPWSTGTGSVTLTLYDIPADVSGTITVGGPPVTIATTVAGQNGKLTFDGVLNQRVSLKITGVTLTGSSWITVSIRKPDGTSLASTTADSGGSFIDTLTLPSTATYSIVVDPYGSGTASATLTLYEVPPDVSGTITPGGAAVSVATTVPGQNAQLTFSGTSGNRVSLKITGVTLNGGPWITVSIRKPDGTSLASTSVDSSGAFMDAQTLTVTGTYSILVDPYKAGTGGATLTLYDVPADVTGTITPGGSPVTVTTVMPGQNARLTFTGAVNQRVSLKINGVTVNGNSWVNVSIRKPDGTSLVSTTVDSSGGYFDTQTLTVAGTYTVLTDLYHTNTGSVTLTLYDVPADATGSITIGGSSVSVNTTVPGQNGKLTLSGTAGQVVTVRVSNNSMGMVTVKLLNPNGTTLASYSSSSSSFDLSTKTLPSTGTYSISIDPSGTNTGGITITAQNGQTGMLQNWAEILSAIARA